MCKDCASIRGMGLEFNQTQSRENLINSSVQTIGSSAIPWMNNSIKIEENQLPAVFNPQSSRYQRRPKPVKLRKSCDFCWRRKLKCEGGNPCNNCSVRNNVCKHSPRKQRGRSDNSDSIDNAKSKSGSTSPIIADQTLEESLNTQDNLNVLVPFSNGNQEFYYDNFMGSDPLLSHENSIKRAKILTSPSIAPGFLGLKEHQFLTSFTIDFLYAYPFIKRSVIQKSIDLVTSGSIPSPPPLASFESMTFDASYDFGEPMIDSDLKLCSSSRDSQAEYQSSCAMQAILWGGVAIGGLLMGSPETSVAKYIVMAEAQMKECFDGEDELTADALMMLGFLYLFLQDFTKFFRYLNYSNNLWTQLPASQRPNLRFTYMNCCLLYQIYGLSDARLPQIFASLTGVHDGTNDEANYEYPAERFIDDIDQIKEKSDNQFDGMANSSDNAIIVPSHMREVLRGIIEKFKMNYGMSVYNPENGNILLNRENMEKLHKIFTTSNIEICQNPSSPSIFRCTVSYWLIVTKLSIGRCHEILEKANDFLSALEAFPGLPRLPNISHKCHALSIVFYHYQQPESYEKMRNIYNEYSSILPKIPAYKDFAYDQSCSCNSPFCRSLCNTLWNRLCEYMGHPIYSPLPSEEIFMSHNKSNNKGFMVEGKMEENMMEMAPQSTVKDEMIESGLGLGFEFVRTSVAQDWNNFEDSSLEQFGLGSTENLLPIDNSCFNSFLNLPEHLFDRDFASCNGITEASL